MPFWLQEECRAGLAGRARLARQLFINLPPGILKGNGPVEYRG